MDLSILIPARNEMFLADTVKDILKNIRGKTEIIVALDGQWANPGIPQHERVKVLYIGKSVGQRSATNQACRLSNAKYVMKIDAHCSVDEGFDVKMMEKMQDNYTMIPTMYNFHVFDWVCTACKHRIYQGPTPEKGCEKCGAKMDREMIWKPRWNRKSTAYRFDKNLKFQYWGAYKERQKPFKGLVDTMSAQGSCFMLTRKRYWELDICDEGHGGWGQQGTEIACKTWLSGGRLVVNLDTWYAHMFRTQGGDFGFPYPLSGNAVNKARKYSQNLFKNNNWDGAVYPFEWLLEKFRPIPEWHEGEEVPKKPQPIKRSGLKKGIVFYTDNGLNLKIAHAVQRQLNKIGLDIVSVSLKKMNFGDNIVLNEKRGPLTMAKQILAGLEKSDADIIYFCEHDVLYHRSHFEFTPPKKDVYYYNTNVWRVRAEDGHALWCDDLRQLSGLCAYRETLIKHFRERIKRIEKDGYSAKMGFEPGTHNRKERVDDLPAENYKSRYPIVDIRHDNNLTPSRWSKDQFRNEKYTKGWTEAKATDLKGWHFHKNEHFYR